MSSSLTPPQSWIRLIRLLPLLIEGGNNVCSEIGLELKQDKPENIKQKDSCHKTRETVAQYKHVQSDFAPKSENNIFWLYKGLGPAVLGLL